MCVYPRDGQCLTPEKYVLGKAGVKTAKAYWKCGFRLFLFKYSLSGASVLEPLWSPLENLTFSPSKAFSCALLLCHWFWDFGHVSLKPISVYIIVLISWWQLHFFFCYFLLNVKLRFISFSSLALGCFSDGRLPGCLWQYFRGTNRHGAERALAQGASSGRTGSHSSMSLNRVQEGMPLSQERPETMKEAPFWVLKNQEQKVAHLHSHLSTLSLLHSFLWSLVRYF